MASERRAVPDLQGMLLARRYRIARALDRGGMGAVYEARDELVGRTVAVKILLPELSREERHVERFRREAVATAGLSHPNVVQVSDFQVEAGAPAFLVMELLSGRTLARALADHGPFAPERVAALGLQVCAALEVAHAAGIVHRDLKPGNVFLVPLGDGRELVKVLDFGIARMKQSGAYARLTATGALLGTPAFMPPEQARGEKVDGRADVYALGAILYTCLTGRKPFSGRDPATVLRQVLGDRPAPVLSLRPDAGARLALAIETALEKDPGRRFGSARALGDALQHALARDSRDAMPAPAGSRPEAAAVAPSLPPPSSPPPSLPPPPLSPRVVLATLAIGALALGLLVAVGIGAWLLVRGAHHTTARLPTTPPALVPRYD